MKAYGKKLRVLNRRARGDLHGHVTYVCYHGCSTLDLVVVSEKLQIINKFFFDPMQNLETCLYRWKLFVSKRIIRIVSIWKNKNASLEIIYKGRKVLFLTAANRSILPTSNVTESQLSTANLIKNIEIFL